jgi:RND family efflux transporter MFP subunit
MNIFRKYRKVAVVSLAFILIAVKLFSNKQTVTANVYTKDSTRSIYVTVAKVQQSAFEFSTQFTGSFNSGREVIISAETQGVITTSLVDEGSIVSAGSLIAIIDNDLLKAALQSAQANYDNARLMLNRFQHASIGDGIPLIQLDKARVEFKAAESQVRTLRKQIEMSKVKAPFPGTITKKTFEKGTMVSPGTPLVTLADLSNLKFEISVSEKELAGLKEGQLITVRTDVYPGIKYEGKITLVSGAGDASHRFLVRIEVKNNKVHRIRSGMYGIAAITNNREQVIAIPRTALTGSAKAPQVFVVKNGIAYLRNIETGRVEGNSVEVIKGLSNGETIVLSGQINLEHHSKVILVKS